MQTRSQTRILNQQKQSLEVAIAMMTSHWDESFYEQLKVEIDFEGASAAWKQNKKYIGNGSYVYKKKNEKCV